MRPLVPFSPCALFVLAVAPVVWAAHPCAPCHQKEVSAYALTGMGNSLGRPVGQPRGKFRHAPSGSAFTILTSDEAMRHRLERGGLRAEYPIEYFIGSGHEGRSYLVRLGDRLFESPASWYTRRGAWDVSPGYQQDRNPDFNRPVTPDCLFCHAGRTGPALAEAISCDRCHGTTERHLARPSSGNIINPRKLQPRARDSTCEQCHLSGEARILNPSRRLQDFAPGLDLEQILAVYVKENSREAGGRESIKVVSHAEQLALSRCKQASGDRMWCGSCHDPHVQPVNATEYYRRKCLECHGDALLSTHSKPDNDCAGCHMARRHAYDGSHTAFTDHQILKKPGATGAAAARDKLKSWKEPPAEFAVRNLGLAYISAGERDQSSFQLNEGFRLLSRLPHPDADAQIAMGLVLMRKNVPDAAAQLFEQALQQNPRDAGRCLNLAAAWKAAGRPTKAIPLLERAIELDPFLEEAYALLGSIYQEARDTGRQRATLQRYLQFRPQDIEARRALSRFQP